jgi:hypothetical protein
VVETISQARSARKYHGNVLLSEPDHVKIVKRSDKNLANRTLQLNCHELKRSAQNQQSFGRNCTKENVFKAHQGQFEQEQSVNLKFSFGTM